MGPRCDSSAAATPLKKNGLRIEAEMLHKRASAWDEGSTCPRVLIRHREQSNNLVDEL